MTTIPARHPFQRKTNLATINQIAIFWLLRAFTYSILIFAAFIFLIIIYKGSPAVFGSFRVDGQVPFLHNDFLFEKPQTLHVFKYDGKPMQLPADAYYAETSDTPAPGVPHLDSNLITDHDTFSYAAGGIWPQIVGTVLLVIGSMAIALTLGIFSAVYLSEYSKQGPLISAIRLAIINLAGVPSIVFGLFGVGLFVLAFGWNISLMAGWFTLAFMVLPVIITASEESLRAVPKGFREGSLALGATKWQTIRLNVLPYALPGILTSSVLGIARVAGETAPILFTAAFAKSDDLPWENIQIGPERLASGFLGYLEYPFLWMHDFVFRGVNALPYHIYVVSSKIPHNEYTEKVQYGTAFVFLAVVMLIALASILLRIRLRNTIKW